MDVRGGNGRDRTGERGGSRVNQGVKPSSVDAFHGREMMKVYEQGGAASADGQVVYAG